MSRRQLGLALLVLALSAGSAVASPPPAAPRPTLEEVLARHLEAVGGEASWLVTRRRERRALHPDVDPTLHTIENRFADFRRDGGVLRPDASTTEDLDTDERLMAIEVLSIAVNSGIEEAFFARPAAGAPGGR